MSFLATCPYCHRGKVRAPASAVGRSATCPSCLSCFTVVEPERAAAPAPAPAGAPVAVPTAAGTVRESVARPGSERVASKRVKPVPTWEQLAPVEDPVPESVLPPLPADFLPPPPVARPSKTALGVALVAISLAGVCPLIAQLPYGRFVAVAVGGLGLLLGWANLAFATRYPRVAVVAPILNAVALFVVILLPEWLGVTTWLPHRPPDPPKGAQAIGFDGAPGGNAEWVDVTRSAWQLDDVRVAARQVSVGPVEVTGAGGKKVRSGRFLQIRVQVGNEGAGRAVEFPGWDPSGPRLTDGAGKPLTPKPLDAFKPQPTTLFPGKTVYQVLVYEVPPKGVEQLRLELPGAALGVAEPVRLLIPRAAIAGAP